MSDRIKKKDFAYFKRSTWKGINSRTINGAHPNWNNSNDARYLSNGIELKFSRLQWNDWCDKHKIEIENLYSIGETPSIDRLSIHYDLDSLRIISVSENCKNARSKSNYKFERKIVGINKDTKEEVHFSSIKEVEEKGMSKHHVWQALNGLKKSAYRYIWFYKDANIIKPNTVHSQNNIIDFDKIFDLKKQKLSGNYCIEKKSHPIIATSNDGMVREFYSVREADRLGFNRSSITYHLGKGSYYKGYRWDTV